MWFRRTIWLLALATTLSVVVPASASAAVYFTRVIQPTAYRWGVEGRGYILASAPTVAAGSYKVNSVFGKTSDDLQSIETGWCWHNQSGYTANPYYFAQNWRDGAVYELPHWGAAQMGTYHTWRVNWNGSQSWNYYLDGVYQRAFSNPKITSAWLYSQAECHSAGDNNYASWSALKYYDYRATTPWKSWPSMSLSVDSSGDLYHYQAVSATAYNSVHN